MADPFLGEIRLFSFAFAPEGWAQCNGQSLPVNQNQALFALLGPTYGGNGQTTFALPNLQGRVAIHPGNGFTQGQIGGTVAETLTVSQMPSHTHAASASTDPPVSRQPAGSPGGAQIWGPPLRLGSMEPAAITSVGGSQPHLNLQPFLAINFCMALRGTFPPRG